MAMQPMLPLCLPCARCMLLTVLPQLRPHTDWLQWPVGGPLHTCQSSTMPLPRPTAHLLETLHAHADASDAECLVLLQPLKVEGAWVSLQCDLGAWVNAILLLQGVQDAAQLGRRHQRRGLGDDIKQRQQKGRSRCQGFSGRLVDAGED